MAVVLFMMNVHVAVGQSVMVERTTDVLCVAPAVAGLCVAICNEDKKGAKELGLSVATGLVASYAIGACVKKESPDGEASHAFPSQHSTLAFTGATFLTKRYGWKWGVPAYAVATYVAWGRTNAKKHDWWDVAAGAALGAGSALIYTRKFSRGVDVSIAPAVMDGDGKGVTACIVF